MAAPGVMQQQQQQGPQPVVPQSHVGFDSITNQIERKLLKRGFQFNVICVGMSPGIVNSVLAVSDTYRSNWTGKIDPHQHNFRFPSYRFKRSPGTRRANPKYHGDSKRLTWFEVSVPSPDKKLIMIVIEENGVRLRLNIVDTPGYGDQVNNDRW